MMWAEQKRRLAQRLLAADPMFDAAELALLASISEGEGLRLAARGKVNDGIRFAVGGQLLRELAAGPADEMRTRLAIHAREP